MAQNRSYPDIRFVDTDPQPIVNALIASYELFTGRTLYPADPARLFILWVADIIAQERAIIDFSAKQNVPRYAQGEYLDSLAEIFKDVHRLGAESATVTLRFYVSAPLAFAQLVPAGTRVTVIDGEITFKTDADLYIAPGSLYGDIRATCQTPGAAGNGFIPGQLTQIVDIYPYFERVENITESAGGADVEGDEAFYERMRDSMESFSTAGPVESYIYHAKSASALISDVSATSPEPGLVDVRVLLQDGKLPTEELISDIQLKLSSDRTRPLTDVVHIGAPDTVPFDINLTYYVHKPSANSAAVLEADIHTAVQAYIKWQTEKIGRDINPSYLIGLVMQTGVKRVVLTNPTFEFIGDGAVAVLNTITVINGGVEDE